MSQCLILTGFEANGSTRLGCACTLIASQVRLHVCLQSPHCVVQIVRGKKWRRPENVVCCSCCILLYWGLLSCGRLFSAGVQLHVCCRRLRGTFDNRRHQEEANTAASLASETSRVMLAGLLELMWHADEDTLKCKLALIALTYFNLLWITNLVLSCSHAGSLLGCRCLSTKGCHDFALQGVCSWGKELCKSLKQVRGFKRLNWIVM